jgi:hypothetical protein
LSKAKRLQQLLFGMPKSKRDRIHGRNRQGPPRRELLTSKVLRIDARIKSILEDKKAPRKVSSRGFRGPQHWIRIPETLCCRNEARRSPPAGNIQGCPPRLFSE